MNANAVTSETQTSNSSDNAASSKNTQFPDNKQMPENPPSNSSADTSGSSTSQPQSNTPGGMGGFDMDADESCVLTINGGTVTINAGGDGIDKQRLFLYEWRYCICGRSGKQWRQCIGLQYLRVHYRRLFPCNRVFWHGTELRLGLHTMHLHTDTVLKCQWNHHGYSDR